MMLRVTDIMFALTRLRRSPRELPAIVLTLAVGAGVVGAGYTVVRAVLYDPLPYESPERLVKIWDGEGTPGYRLVASRHAEILHTEATLLDGVATYIGLQQELGPDGTRRPVVKGQRVSVNLFEVLGVHPIAGRAFTVEDQRPAAVLPVIVSERLVERGAVRGQPGDTILLDNLAHTIVGIMPARFWFPEREVDYWVPIVVVPPELLGAGRTSVSSATLARLARDADAAAAQAQVNAVLVSAVERPAFHVRSYGDDLREPLRAPLVLLQAGALLVLVLACLNACWLFTARAQRFEHAFAIMRAVGASRQRVFAGWVIEAAAIGAVVAPAAALIAWSLLRGIQSLDSGEVAQVADTALTGRALALTLMLAALGSMVSAVPAGVSVTRRSARHDVSGSLRTPSTTGGRVRADDRPGRDGVRTGSAVCAPAHGAARPAPIERRLRAHQHRGRPPGCQDGAGRSGRSGGPVHTRSGSPGADGHSGRGGQRPPADTIRADDQRPACHGHARRSGDVMVRVRVVSPSYFHVAGIGAIDGRLLTAADEGPGRVVVNEALPTKVLGGVEAGSTGIVFSQARWEVIGVVRTVRHADLLEDPVPELYMLYGDVRRLLAHTASMVVRPAFIVAPVERSAASTLERIREVVSRELPEAQIADTWHFRDLLWVAAGARPLLTIGASVFAAVALVLMTAGFYGMVSDGLALRQREIGVRMALGATPARVARESLLPSLAVYVVALGLGLTVVLIVRGAVAATVFIPAGAGEPPAGLIVGLAALVLACAMAVACYRPVRKAAAVDPAVALRAE